MQNNHNITRIIKMFGDHYDGNPWIDVTIVGTLSGINAKQASQNVNGLNSIWQIVNHIISWRKVLLSRVKGKPAKVPSNNFISGINDKSPAAWKRTLKKFELSQKAITGFLTVANDGHLEKISPTSGYSYYELVMSILIHDTYHLGQIVLISKIIK